MMNSTERTGCGAGCRAGALAGCRGRSPPRHRREDGIKVDFGVTDEPCPQAIDDSKGCIYLGTISDLTEGPFKALGGADHRRAEGVLEAGQRGRAASAATRST